MEKPLLYAEVNIIGSLVLLELARAYGCRKIIYASTGGAVYGEPEYLPVDEDHPIHPLDPYGASKHHVEHYLDIYRTHYDVDYAILRYSNVYGPRQDPYGEAGVTDPRGQIDLAEVHDCFSIVELLTYEDLGFCAPGEARELLRSGATGREGDIPVNVSGGLLSCGHPVGATGIRMVCEVCEHLRESAGERQIPGARLGLTHNIGGPGAVAAVTILGKEAG